MTWIESLLEIQPNLPSEYLDTISSTENCVTYEFGNTYNEAAFSAFSLYSPESLLEATEIIGAPTVPYCHILQSLTRLQAETSEEPGIHSPEGMLRTERVANGFVIGMEEDGDPIYLDPEDNFSVWRYWHDGGDVVKLSPSFAGFISSGYKPQ